MQDYKLLIVDDDKDDLFLIQDVLDEEGVKNVKYFNKSVDCLEYLNKCSLEELPTTVMTDLNMPVFSGFDVIKIIKENQRLSHINVIVCTTSRAQLTIDICKNLGAMDYLIKPFQASEYVELVNRIKDYA